MEVKAEYYEFLDEIEKLYDSQEFILDAAERLRDEVVSFEEAIEYKGELEASLEATRQEHIVRSTALRKRFNFPLHRWIDAEDYTVRFHGGMLQPIYAEVK